MGHSRIYQLSDKPLNKRDFISSYDIPDHLYSKFADCLSDSCNREEDIRILKSCLGKSAIVFEDRVSLCFEPREYFQHKYERFSTALKELKGITLEDFCSNSGIGSILHELRSAHEETFGFYVYIERSMGNYKYPELMSLDAWVREASKNPNVTWHIGGTVDYHY